MNSILGGGWVSPKDVGTVRRTTWTTALAVVATVILVLTATNLPT